MVHGFTREHDYLMGGDKEAFLEKYQDYCKSRHIKEEIFKFAQKEDENMEDYLEPFRYIL